MLGQTLFYTFLKDRYCTPALRLFTGVKNTLKKGQFVAIIEKLFKQHFKNIQKRGIVQLLFKSEV